MFQGYGRVGNECHFASIALELLFLLCATASGIGLCLCFRRVVQSQQGCGVSCRSFSLGFGTCLGGGLFFFFLGFLLFLLGLVFLLAFALDGGGSESFVGIGQELGMVVQCLEVNAPVDVQGTLGVDGIAQGAAVFQLGTTLPGVLCLIGAVGLQPVCQGQFLERYLIRYLCALGIVQGRTEAFDALQHAVLPCGIAVGIEVLVHRSVGLFDFGMCAALEGEVQCPGEIPPQIELAVPEEGGCPSDRDRGRRLQVLHIALLDFVVGTYDIGTEREALWCEAEVLGLHQIQPFALRLDVLEGLPRFPVRRPVVVQSSLPRLFVLVSRSLSSVVGVAVAVVEGEVCGVVGHRMLRRLDIDLHAAEREVLAGLQLGGETGDAVALLARGGGIEGIAQFHIVVQRVVFWLHALP